MLTAGKVSFPGAQGDMLAASLDLPSQQPAKYYVLFAHCFTCTKDVLAASRIANELTQNGVGVLRFDFTGLGASEGDFANTNFSSNVGDLIAAADFMRKENIAPSIVMGHSLGGSAVLAAAAEIPDAKAIVTVGSPSDVAHVAHNFASSRDEILEKGEAEVCLVGRPFRIKRQFIEDIEGAKLEEHVKKLGKALLIFHAPRDQTVSIENAAEIFKWAKHPKSFISLDDADHLVTKKQDAEYIARTVVSWAQRYL